MNIRLDKVDMQILGKVKNKDIISGKTNMGISKKVVEQMEDACKLIRDNCGKANIVITPENCPPEGEEL